jgi:hypothetical protein
MPRNSRVYIYVIRQKGRKKPVKIGYTVNLQARFSSMQCNSPNILTLAGAFAVVGKVDAYFLEQSAHHEFRAARIYGEWFMIEPREALQFIEQLANKHKIMMLRGITVSPPKNEQYQYFKK